jgi:hypothetical protein
VFADLGVQNGWYVENDARIMGERVLIRVYQATDLGRLIDFEFRWEATGKRVTLPGSDSGECRGGFYFRFAGGEDPVIITSSGVRQNDDDLPQVMWSDFAARISGGKESSGAAIFSHPDNPSFPGHWLLRRSGLSGVILPGPEPCELRPGSPLTARYRLLLHRHDAVEADITSAWRAWENPAQAQFLAESR